MEQISFLASDGGMGRDEPAVEVFGVQSESSITMVRQDVGVADRGRVGGEEAQEVGGG